MSGDDEKAEHVHKRIAPLVEAVGYVATHFARLEHEINQEIWALCDLEPADGACLTSQIGGLLPRMRALIALVHRHGGSDLLLKDLNTFTATADKLARRRNRAVHDPWYYSNSDARLFGRLEVTADRRLVYEVKPHTRGQVLEIAHDIIAAFNAFTALRQRIKGELRGPPESRPHKRSEAPPDLPDQDTAP